MIEIIKKWLITKLVTDIQLWVTEEDVCEQKYLGRPTSYNYKTGQLFPIPDKPYKIFVRLK